MKTRAAVHTTLGTEGDTLLIDEIEYADPAEGQIQVKLFASGICHSQVHTMKNPHGPLPQVIGHERTGVVEAIGTGVTHVKEGDHVMLTLDPARPAPRRPATQPRQDHL